MNTVKEWAAFIVLGAFAWGTSFLWIKVAVAEIDPFMVVLLRLFFGLVIIWPFIMIKRLKLNLEFKTLGFMALVGIINTAVPFTLITWGEKFIDSGLAGILNGTVPLFTILIAHLALHDDRISMPKITGLLAGFAGLVILMGGNLESLALSENLYGQLAVVLAAIMYAGSSVIVRRYLKEQPPMLIAGVSMTSAFIFMMLFTPITQGGYILPTLPITWLAVVWMGVLGTALAYLLYFYLIQAWGPTRSTLVTYVMPVVAVLLGVLFLGEKPTWQLVAGGLLIIVGVAAVNYRPRRNSTGAPAAVPGK